MREHAPAFVDGDVCIAGHQPNFLPWFGYFEKWLLCDVFVHSDDVRFPHKSFTNRTRIVLDGREVWATLPMVRKSRARIFEAEFTRDSKQRSHLLGQLLESIRGSRYEKEAKNVIDLLAHLMGSCNSIACLNIQMNSALARSFGISTRDELGTRLGLDRFAATQRIVARCRLLGGTTYLSGQGSGGYQDDALLMEQGIASAQLRYCITNALFGELRHLSILMGIANVGLATIRAHVDAQVESLSQEFK